MEGMKKDSALGIRLDFPRAVGRRAADNTKHLALRFLMVHMVGENGMVGIWAAALGKAAVGMEIVEREVAESA